MSNPAYQHDPVDRHLREAARWLVMLQQPDLSPRVLLRWNKWQALPHNREAFDTLQAVWHAMQPAADTADSARNSKTCTAIPERLRTVSEEAAYWYFLCVDDPGMMRLDRREFLVWMRRSPEHIAELFNIAQLDGELRRLKLAMRSLGLNQSNVVALAEPDSANRLHRESKAPDEKKTGNDMVSKRTLTFKLAAFAASLFFGVALAFVAQDYMHSEQVVTTGASQWHHMTLPDGTAVHIDARSRVEVAYTDKERIVHVYEGSAVFDVSKDPKRPFIARTHLVDAMAVGTRFGVEIDPGVTTTVSEGVVKVIGRGKSDGKAVMLKAGEELRVSNSSLQSPHFAHVDAERKLAWAQSGLLLLGGLTVEEGVDQLNRRNRVQIIIESPALASKVVQFASVKVDSPETYAKAIARESGVSMVIDRENNVIRLSE